MANITKQLRQNFFVLPAGNRCRTTGLSFFFKPKIFVPNKNKKY